MPQLDDRGWRGLPVGGLRRDPVQGHALRQRQPGAMHVLEEPQQGRCHSRCVGRPRARAARGQQLPGARALCAAAGGARSACGLGPICARSERPLPCPAEPSPASLAHPPCRPLAPRRCKRSLASPAAAWRSWSAWPGRGASTTAAAASTRRLTCAAPPATRPKRPAAAGPTAGCRTAAALSGWRRCCCWPACRWPCRWWVFAQQLQHLPAGPCAALPSAPLPRPLRTLAHPHTAHAPLLPACSWAPPSTSRAPPPPSPASCSAASPPAA
jgi:hypothetical protein